MINLELLGTLNLKEKLTVANLRDYYTKCGDWMLYSITENFDREGRFSSLFEGGTKKWQDLAESTKAGRKVVGKWPGKILQVTGALASSVDYSIEPEGITLFLASPAGKYGAYLHHGTPAYNIPKTELSRKYFWYMFFKTKELMYKRMALSKKTSFKRPAMPPRPILVLQEKDKAMFVKYAIDLFK